MNTKHSTHSFWFMHLSCLMPTEIPFLDSVYAILWFMHLAFYQTLLFTSCPYHASRPKSIPGDCLFLTLCFDCVAHDADLSL